MKTNKQIRKRIRRILTPACLALSIVLAVFVTGCGAGGGAPMAEAPMESNDMMYKSSAQGYAEGSGGTVAEYDAESVSARVGGDSPEQGRKEIKNVRCALVVKDVQATYNRVSEAVRRFGGYEFSKSESQRNNFTYIDITVKLPPETLSEFEQSLRSAEGENAFRHYNMYSDDITSSYYDVASRLDSMKAALMQYHALISKANTIKDMLEIQREITALQADIDSLQGQLNMWNTLVSFATVSITIEREDDPLAQSKTAEWSFNSPGEILNAMGNGFIATGNAVYRVIVGILVIIVSMLPLLIPAGVIIFFIIRYRRRHKQRKTAADAAVSATAKNSGAVGSATVENPGAIGSATADTPAAPDSTD